MVSPQKGLKKFCQNHRLEEFDLEKKRFSAVLERKCVAIKRDTLKKVHKPLLSAIDYKSFDDRPRSQFVVTSCHK